MTAITQKQLLTPDNKVLYFILFPSIFHFTLFLWSFFWFVSLFWFYIFIYFLNEKMKPQWANGKNEEDLRWIWVSRADSPFVLPLEDFMKVEEVALWTDEDFIKMQSGSFQGYK